MDPEEATEALLRKTAAERVAVWASRVRDQIDLDVVAGRLTGEHLHGAYSALRQMEALAQSAVSQIVCGGCANGLPVCGDRKPDGGRYTHAETCADYIFDDDLCDACDGALLVDHRNPDWTSMPTA